MISRARTIAVTLALATSFALGGCAANSSGMAEGSSAQLRSTVVTAAEQAAAGDSAGALDTLDALQAQLDEGTAAGEISSERAATIQTALDAVRAGLQPAPAETTAPVETEPVETVDTDPEPVAPEPADPEPTAPDTVTDAPAGDDGEGGDDGKGKGNGNGKENGNSGKGKNK